VCSSDLSKEVPCILEVPKAINQLFGAVIVGETANRLAILD
jgi:hypothetical protein